MYEAKSPEPKETIEALKREIAMHRERAAALEARLAELTDRGTDAVDEGPGARRRPEPTRLLPTPMIPIRADATRRKQVGTILASACIVMFWAAHALTSTLYGATREPAQAVVGVVAPSVDPDRPVSAADSLKAVSAPHAVSGAHEEERKRNRTILAPEIRLTPITEGAPPQPESAPPHRKRHRRHHRSSHGESDADTARDVPKAGRDEERDAPERVQMPEAPDDAGRSANNER